LLLFLHFRVMSRLSILVVEDDFGVAEVLSSALAEMGAEVAVAEGVAAARALVGERSFDRAVVDVVLRDGSGKQLAEFLRMLRIPCLLMTGHPAMLAELRTGGVDVMAKPFGAAELRRWFPELTPATGDAAEAEPAAPPG
jgi:DNA-binding response OmpR family regulator